LEFSGYFFPTISPQSLGKVHCLLGIHRSNELKTMASMAMKQACKAAKPQPAEKHELCDVFATVGTGDA
jgi:hypothetical protein